jgi:hypothetical protein
VDKVEAIARILTDQAEVPMLIYLRVACVMFTCLKVVMRSPDLHGPLKHQYTQMNRRLEKVMAEYNPQVLRIINSLLLPRAALARTTPIASRRSQ